MAVKVSTQVTIKDTPDTVFKYLSDLSYHFLWNPHLMDINPTAKLKAGFKYKSTSMVLGVKVRADNMVTKLVPEKELQIENKTGLVQYKVNYKLRQNHKNTVVICTTNVAAKSSAFAFTAPVLRMLARRELQTDLGYLKIAVEQKLK